MNHSLGVTPDTRSGLPDTGLHGRPVLSEGEGGEWTRPARISYPHFPVLSLKRTAVLFIAIALLLAPFVDHRSAEPVFLTFSWHYLLFLTGLAVSGLSLAIILSRAVRRAPPHRKLPFAFVLLGALVSILLAVEAVLGYLGRDLAPERHKWGQILSPFMGFENAPNHRWEIAGAVYTTDADTFRTHTAPRVSAEEETLIVVMGGSSAFGYGLNDNETLAHRLEHKLRARFDDRITVLNAANTGHNSLQQLFRFYNRVLPLKPELVVYYGAINDVRPRRMLNRMISLAPGVPEASTARQYLRLTNKGQGFYFENSLLMGRFKAIAETAYKRWTNGRHNDRPAGKWWDYTVEEYVDTAALYIRNLDTLRLICRANGITFIPVSFIGEFDELLDAWEIGTTHYVKRLREHCAENGFPLINLNPAFEREKDKARLFFPDHYHPSPDGAAFIASQVADALIPIIAELPENRATSVLPRMTQTTNGSDQPE